LRAAVTNWKEVAFFRNIKKNNEIRTNYMYFLQLGIFSYEYERSQNLHDSRILGKLEFGNACRV
jgi:hypothetical protein